jgi:hypothetical protein
MILFYKLLLYAHYKWVELLLEGAKSLSDFSCGGDLLAEGAS